MTDVGTSSVGVEAGKLQDMYRGEIHPKLGVDISSIGTVKKKKCVVLMVGEIVKNWTEITYLWH